MAARIFSPPKPRCSRAWRGTREWILEYEPEQPKLIEPLMGWTSSTETQAAGAHELREQGGRGRLRHAPGRGHSCRGAAKDGAETEVLRESFKFGPLDRWSTDGSSFRAIVSPVTVVP